MKSDEVIANAKRLCGIIRSKHNNEEFVPHNAQVVEFLRKFAGPTSAFVDAALDAANYYPPEGPYRSGTVLLSFAEFIEAGLGDEITAERRAQLDVVSDLIEQAQSLIDNAAVHPAAPAVLIGATLEEFLRTWIQAKNLSLGTRKAGIDSYVQTLRDAELINKQDAKDITAWAGLRNHAAHGEWNLVGTKESVSLMLQGVNLFMRKYESGKAA